MPDPDGWESWTLARDVEVWAPVVPAEAEVFLAEAELIRVRGDARAMLEPGEGNR